ncbi:hypothetical protein BDV96DRAFT_601737 [Lophiotrema nucula]|uniref:Uncharacterized protein n=1 Tax=Lophiotrema nucula TaxID=690887 RepID=A0A6A5Z239_9PLEO|nr:hypothetical protein BDV96DRAFT_601737 [Lophiotrema nucula]
MPPARPATGTAANSSGNQPENRYEIYGPAHEDVDSEKFYIRWYKEMYDFYKPVMPYTHWLVDNLHAALENRDGLTPEQNETQRKDAIFLLNYGKDTLEGFRDKESTRWLFQHPAEDLADHPGDWDGKEEACKKVKDSIIKLREDYNKKIDDIILLLQQHAKIDDLTERQLISFPDTPPDRGTKVPVGGLLNPE